MQMRMSNRLATGRKDVPPKIVTLWNFPGVNVSLICRKKFVQLGPFFLVNLKRGFDVTLSDSEAGVSRLLIEHINEIPQFRFVHQVCLKQVIFKAKRAVIHNFTITKTYFPLIHLCFPLAFLIVVCQHIDMICVNCFHGKTKVTNSRPHKKNPGTWRRRNCPDCGITFTTYEKPALDDSVTVHYPGEGGKKGLSAAFSLSKLTLSVAASFPHDAVTRQLHSLSLAETVEQLLISQVKQPSVDDIAATTHQVLKRFDELAALQYAAAHGLVEATRSRRGRPSVR